MYYPHLVKPRRNRGWLSGRSIGIDQSNPIARSLLVACFPGLTYGLDCSGNNNNGAISSSTPLPARALSYFGNVATFSPGSAFGTTASGINTNATPASLRVSNQISVILWAKSRITQVHAPFGDNDASISGSDREALTIFDNNGQFWTRVRTSADATVSGGTWSAGKWYQVATTYDGATVRLYANGAQVSSGSQSGNIYSSQSTWHIGNRGSCTSSSGEFYYDGQIGAVLIFGRSLSASEVLSLYTDPYQFLILPEDVVAARLSGLAALSGSLSATIAGLSNAAAGQVIVSGQL